MPRLESYEEDLGDAYWEKGRCQEWLGVHEGWGFLSTLGTLNTPLRRSVGVKRAIVHLCGKRVNELITGVGRGPRSGEDHLWEKWVDALSSGAVPWDSQKGWVAAALRLGIHQRGVAGLHFAEYDAKWKEVGTEPISAGELWGSRVCQQ